VLAAVDDGTYALCEVCGRTIGESSSRVLLLLGAGGHAASTALTRRSGPEALAHLPSVPRHAMCRRQRDRLDGVTVGEVLDAAVELYGPGGFSAVLSVSADLVERRSLPPRAPASRDRRIAVLPQCQR